MKDQRRTADLVFTRNKLAIFIDGCFWHGCPEHGRVTFNSNVDYWPAKIALNRARDMDTNKMLAQDGWSVLRFWEHQDPIDISDAIEAKLGELRSQRHL